MINQITIDGLYRHYKGNLYRVLHIANHTETEELMVVYQAQYGEQGIWVRPLAMFLEDVQLSDGTVVKRFQLESGHDANKTL